jgi:hypothetical protein
MKRIAKVLVATALMLVLMATTVSPAFAVAYGTEDEPDGPEGYGVNKECHGEYGPVPGCGHGEGKEKKDRR